MRRGGDGSNVDSKFPDLVPDGFPDRVDNTFCPPPGKPDIDTVDHVAILAIGTSCADPPCYRAQFAPKCHKFLPRTMKS